MSIQPRIACLDNAPSAMEMLLQSTAYVIAFCLNKCVHRFLCFFFFEPFCGARPQRRECIVFRLARRDPQFLFELDSC